MKINAPMVIRESTILQKSVEAVSCSPVLYSKMTAMEAVGIASVTVTKPFSSLGSPNVIFAMSMIAGNTMFLHNTLMIIDFEILIF